MCCNFFLLGREWSKMFRRIYFYRPRSEGYVFTGVCRSVTERGRGGGGEGGQHQRSTAYAPPGQVRGQPPTPPLRLMGERYASYWNAFLSEDVLILTLESTSLINPLGITTLAQPCCSDRPRCSCGTMSFLLRSKSKT